MIPKVAVVCAAHTQLGRKVLHILLRSTYIRHVYGLSEMDIRDNLSLSPHHLLKLTLLVHPLDYLERTIATSVPEVDFAFYCLCTPRHVVPTLGAYLFHKLNYDIPLRFLHEMTQLSAFSVAIFSHPSASPSARSHYLRVKGDLVASAERVIKASFPNSPRLAIFNVPALAADPRRPLEDHEIDHMHNGIRPAPLSPMDRIKQRVALKHDPDSSRPLRLRDIAGAMVADAIDSIDTVNRDQISQLRHYGRLIETIDPARIVQLASTARALRTVRSTVRKGRASMKDKVSSYARQQPDAFPSTSTPGRTTDLDDHPRLNQHFSPRMQNTHSVHALAEQSKRTLTKVVGNDMLPDVDTSRGERRTTEIYHRSPQTNAHNAFKRNSPGALLSRSNSSDFRTPPATSQVRKASLDLAPSPPPHRSSRKKRTASPHGDGIVDGRRTHAQSFHYGTAQSFYKNGGSEKSTSRHLISVEGDNDDYDWPEPPPRVTFNHPGNHLNQEEEKVGFGGQLSSLVGRVMAAVERPSVRRERRNLGR